MKLIAKLRKHLWIPLAGILLALLVYSGVRYWYSIITPTRIQEDDIREAVIHQGLGEQLTGCGHGEIVCCVSFTGIGDPTPSFLARFHGQFIKGSACSIDKSTHFPVEVKTGKRAVVVELGSIQWLGTLQAEIDISMYCGMLCGQGGKFVVHRELHEWVAEITSFWVS